MHPIRIPFWHALDFWSYLVLDACISLFCSVLDRSLCFCLVLRPWRRPPTGPKTAKKSPKTPEKVEKSPKSLREVSFFWGLFDLFGTFLRLRTRRAGKTFWRLFRGFLSGGPRDCRRWPGDASLVRRKLPLLMCVPYRRISLVARSAGAHTGHSVASDRTFLAEATEWPASWTCCSGSGNGCGESLLC